MDAQSADLGLHASCSPRRPRPLLLSPRRLNGNFEPCPQALIPRSNPTAFQTLASPRKFPPAALPAALRLVSTSQLQRPLAISGEGLLAHFPGSALAKNPTLQCSFLCEWTPSLIPRRPTLSQKPSLHLATHHSARTGSFVGCPGCPQRRACTGQFLSPPPQPCCLNGPPRGLEQGHPQPQCPHPPTRRWAGCKSLLGSRSLYSR